MQLIISHRSRTRSRVQESFAKIFTLSLFAISAVELVVFSAIVYNTFAKIPWLPSHATYLMLITGTFAFIFPYRRRSRN